MRQEDIPMRDRILESLAREEQEGWVSGEALSREFHISRAAVTAELTFMIG